MSDIVRVRVVGTAEAGVWKPVWMPIETAPQADQAHPVLVIDRHRDMSIAYRCDDEWRAMADGLAMFWDNGGGPVELSGLTHWMPLPPPPTDDA